jgi:hypothetical protein
MFSNVTEETKDTLIKVKDSFKKIKEDNEVLLDGINQNTNEIQSNYEFLCRLEAKVDLINEKVEALQIRLTEIDESTEEKEERIDLTYEEKKIFLVIYKYSTNKKFLTYSETAKKLNIPISMARFYVTNLIEKNVPIIKKYRNREVFVGLDDEFREKQAKENVVNINESITKYI